MNIKTYIKIFCMKFIALTPWYKALMLSAWVKYTESKLFRYRWIEFSRQMAASLYSYNEHIFFLEKVKEDKELMKKIIYTSFSVINDVEDYDIRKFVKF